MYVFPGHNMHVWILICMRVCISGHNMHARMHVYVYVYVCVCVYLRRPPYAPAPVPTGSAAERRCPGAVPRPLQAVARAPSRGVMPVLQPALHRVGHHRDRTVTVIHTVTAP